MGNGCRKARHSPLASRHSTNESIRKPDVQSVPDLIQGKPSEVSTTITESDIELGNLRASAIGHLGQEIEAEKSRTVSVCSFPDIEVAVRSVPDIALKKLRPFSVEGLPIMAESCSLQIAPPVTDMTNVVPSIGKPAPQFKGMAVVNGEFKEISLADYAGKYVIFFFYPLDFTFVCPTEIIAFSDRAKEFRDIGVEIIGCSTDSHFSHFAWINTPRKQGGLGHMDIPLLADKNCSIAKAYGVYKEDEGLAFRGLFIIDPSQNLRQVTINDLPVGRSVDETLRLVQAFQFTDKHGEVCPAGWKPGDKTIDTKKSSEYFESV